MKNIITLFILILAMLWGTSSCQNQAAADAENGSTAENEQTQSSGPQALGDSISLKKFWESDPYLETSESVLYAYWDSTLLVSCIYGKPTEKDGNGVISKISLENGQTIQERFTIGLNAPKGMGVSPDAKTLYVTDIDRLVAIHARSGTILKEYPVKGAKFLNDVFVDPRDSSVYFSDTETGYIHRLYQDEIAPIAQVKAPNGITSYSDSLLVVLSFAGNEMFLVNRISKEVRSISPGIPDGDGIVPDGQGGFFASAWSGQVYHLNHRLTPTLLLDTRDKEINAADIEYIPEQGLLLVPTFFKNSVTAYRVQ